MAPQPLRRLINAQGPRLAEIQAIGDSIFRRDPDGLNVDIIQSRIDEVKEIWGEVRRAHAEIINRNEAQDEAYVTDNVFANLRTTYEGTLDQLLTKKNELAAPELTIGRPALIDANQVDSGPTVAKLPRIDLPRFSGKMEEWETFRALFSSLVHNVKRLSDTTKLQYLASCLVGPAFDLIHNIAITDANYLPTWRALNERYHKPRLILSNHFDTLMNILPVKRGNAGDLRRFTDDAKRTVRAMEALRMPVEYWDQWLIHIFSSRLDSDSRLLWEAELSLKEKQAVMQLGNPEGEIHVTNSFPKFSEFTDFLERRAQTLCMAGISGREPQPSTSTGRFTHASHLPRRVLHVKSASHQSNPGLKCPECKGNHHVRKCPQFLAKNATERHATIRQANLCYNCLGPHRSRQCKSEVRCNKCKGAHHSLLHFEGRVTTRSNTRVEQQTEKPAENKPGINVLTARVQISSETLLFATAVVTIIGEGGRSTRVKALLDPASHRTLISRKIAQLLRLLWEKANVPLVGIGATPSGIARAAASFILGSPINPEFRLDVKALILPHLTGRLPSRQIVQLDPSLFEGLTLADPEYFKPGTIELLIGVDFHGRCMGSQMRQVTSDGLLILETVFGWAISGPIPDAIPRRAEPTTGLPVRTLHITTGEELHVTLQKFWDLEEVTAPASRASPEDQLSEQHFRDSHSRDRSGRFCVALPFRATPPSASSETRRIARLCLDNQLRRFKRSPEVEVAYREFMQTYEQLGHMQRVPSSELINPNAWYLPHNAVIKASDQEFKIRVVFDASRRIREHGCLNDYLLAGPALQRDLSLILLNWRRYKYVFTADIVKMFRQIQVRERDQDFQRILWSPEPDRPPIEYRLTTVTYGTSCAPFLAILTLLQLATSEQSRFPAGARCLETETYVDDTFSGGDNLQDAIVKRDELIAILQSAGIKLDKWSANHSDLLLDSAATNSSSSDRVISRDEVVKTLGVAWVPADDHFQFRVAQLDLSHGKCTKRAILSVIARLFDPLGWITPVTVVAKILMQDIWILNYDWDTVLPIEIRQRWIEYCSSLANLTTVSLDRWLGTCPSDNCQLHGFADA